MARDDFPSDTKDLLAHRVGMRCSNPNCRKPTSGPQDDPGKSINVGVAAHITAASTKGPRYDVRLSKEERCASDNGIWLCQTCAKLIDNDELRYTVGLLQEWKRLSEKAAHMAIECNSEESVSGITDNEIINFFAVCFDRPAFQDVFMQEGSMESFDRAISDTITAINTGCLRARDGTVLTCAKGKAFLQNVKWRDRMDVIVDMLRAIRSRYEDACKSGAIHLGSEQDGYSFYCINDHEVACWMDNTRFQILELFSEIAREACVKPFAFPRSHRRW
ncbi:HNH endonuclease [bacterium]|nr:HNH endonuclease [bacterium]